MVEVPYLTRVAERRARNENAMIADWAAYECVNNLRIAVAFIEAGTAIHPNVLQSFKRDLAKFDVAREALKER